MRIATTIQCLVAEWMPICSALQITRRSCRREGGREGMRRRMQGRTREAHGSDSLGHHQFGLCSMVPFGYAANPHRELTKQFRFFDMCPACVSQITKSWHRRQELHIVISTMHSCLSTRGRTLSMWRNSACGSRGH